MLIDAAPNILREESPVLHALRIIDQAQAKIALVVDGEGKLVGSVVDGDIRRGLLRGLDLTTPVRELMHRKPFVLPVSTPRQKILESMHTLEIRQVPLVAPNGTLAGIAVHDVLLGIQHEERPNRVVIMAGGKGRRLLPLTQDLPKPLVPVAGKPILEWILVRLTHYGFREFTLAINYLGQMIEDYFGDGSRFGCRITYSREKEFLGTAGALSLVQADPHHPVVVMNGDILSAVHFGDLVDFHDQGGYSATVCARSHRVEVPYGVLDVDDGLLRGLVEKPVYDNLISAGIYVLSPPVLGRVPRDSYLDMPDLLLGLVQDSQDVGVFVLEDEWIDVGRVDDLERAKRDFAPSTRG